MLKKIRDCDKIIKRGWKLTNPNPDEIVLENPNYIRIEVVANCDGGYDQIVRVEPSGAVAVVLADRKKDKIYLHTEKRQAVLKESGLKIKKGELFVPFDHLGEDSIEIVRGFGEGDWKDTAMAELKEEAGYDVPKNNLKRLGRIVADTGTDAHNTAVVLADFDSQKPPHKLTKEETKKISKGKWYSIKEVKELIKENKIFCARTLAALNIYFQNYP